MLKVKKGNRVVTVEGTDLDVYLERGYDQVKYNESSNSYDIVRKATGGKYYTVKEYNRIVEEKESLLESTGILVGQIEDYKKEVSSLNKKIKEIQK